MQTSCRSHIVSGLGTMRRLVEEQLCRSAANWIRFVKWSAKYVLGKFPDLFLAGIIVTAKRRGCAYTAEIIHAQPVFESPN